MHSSTSALEMNFVFEHPMGPLQGCVTERGLAALLLPGPECPFSDCIRTVNCPVAAKLTKALDRFFSGKAESFEGISLDLYCGTPFQRSVWEAARAVKWGQTSTYGAIARGLGKNCQRAVGQALGANPVPLIVPCHRILAADGTLRGFSAGLEWKRELLRVEGTSWL